MKTVVYCAETYEQASRKAAGRNAIIFTCPPHHEHNLDAIRAAMQAADLILFNLHGLPDGAAWLAHRSGPPVAIRANQLASFDLSGAVIFVESCYTGDPDNPMHQALEKTGCRAIIAGAGENFGGSVEMAAADWLFWALRQAMQIVEFTDYKLNIKRIIEFARSAFEMSRDFHNRDTAQFEVWQRGKKEVYDV